MNDSEPSEMLEAPQQAKQLLLMMLMAASKHIGCHSLVPTLKKNLRSLTFVNTRADLVVARVHLGLPA